MQVLRRRDPVTSEPEKAESLSSDSLTVGRTNLGACLLALSLFISGASKGRAEDEQQGPINSDNACLLASLSMHDKPDAEINLKMPKIPQNQGIFNVVAEERRDLIQLYSDLNDISYEKAEEDLHEKTSEDIANLVENGLIESKKQLLEDTKKVKQQLEDAIRVTRQAPAQAQDILERTNRLERLTARFEDLRNQPDKKEEIPAELKQRIEDFKRRLDEAKEGFQGLNEPEDSSLSAWIRGVFFSIGVVGLFFKATINAFYSRRALDGLWGQFKGDLDKDAEGRDLSLIPRFVLQGSQIRVCNQIAAKVPDQLQELLSTFGVGLKIEGHGHATRLDLRHCIEFSEIAQLTGSVSTGTQDFRRLRPLMTALTFPKFGFGRTYAEQNPNSLLLVNALIGDAVNTLLYDQGKLQQRATTWINYASFFARYADKLDSLDASFFKRFKQAARLPEDFFNLYREAERARTEVRTANICSDKVIGEMNSAISLLMRYLGQDKSPKHRIKMEQVVDSFLQDCVLDLGKHDKGDDPFSVANRLMGSIKEYQSQGLA